MTVQRIERVEVATRALEILRLDGQTGDLFSVEGLSASLRRAAAFLCPASPRQVVDTVMDALAPLTEELERQKVVDVLDALIMSGDLLELRQTSAQARLLYLGPPSFVEKHAGEYLLLGIRPGNVSLLDEGAGLDVIYDGHCRTVLVDPASGDAPLMAAGLHRLSRKQWTKAPRNETAAQVIETARERLGAEQAAAGLISGLTIIDPAKSVLYYKGRWREPTSDDTGIFCGRRPQAYGAPIWCIVEIAAGVPQSVLDLPVDSNVAPGWDEARRFQAARDAVNGSPQVYRARPDGQTGSTTFDFFGPLPTWAERYLAISGWPAPKGPKSLFSYCLPASATQDVAQFLSASLWMATTKEDR